ncbi:MAG: hypothetical protein M3Q87_02290 [Actinomycetota bacterium]|nr:hypothetical protein [Actinomycetota bacterium]
MSRVGVTPKPWQRLARLSPFGSVAAGSAVGQIALAASLPLVARLYSPAEIGVFAVLLANGHVAAIVLTGRLEQILPRLPVERRWTTARLCIVLGCALAPVGAVVMFSLADRSGLTELTLVIILVASLCVLSTAVSTLLAVQDYRRVGQLRLSNGVVTAVAQVAGGLLAPSVATLLLTYSVGNLTAALLAMRAAASLRAQGNAESLRTVAAEERLGPFAAQVGTGAVLSNLGIALPLVGVSVLFGDATAGAFFLARRFLMVPTQLVAASVSEVSYAMVARESAAAVSELVHSWLGRYRSVALVVAATGLALAPIVPRLVGGGYPDIGWVIVLLTLPAVAQMVATSFANILLALRREGVRTAWNVFRLAGLLLLYWWAMAVDADFLTAVAVLSGYLVVAYAALLAVTLRLVRVQGAAP